MARKKREGIEEEILNFIKEFMNEHGYSPSVREIGSAVGFSSSSTIHGYIKRLEEEGRLVMAADKTRTINLKEEKQSPFADMPDISTEHIDVPVVGSVAAGLPITAEENITDAFPLPAYFARGGEVFMLKVKGDSMINAGILNGDYVIVKKQTTAKAGEIIVARIDEEATVKRYYNEGNVIRIQPENDYMEPIYSDNVIIEGKVIGVFRTNVI